MAAGRVAAEVAAVVGVDAEASAEQVAIHVVYEDAKPRSACFRRSRLFIRRIVIDVLSSTVDILKIRSDVFSAHARSHMADRAGWPKLRLSAAVALTDARPSLGCVVGNAAMDALIGERKALLARIEQEREQLERLREIAASLEQRLAHDERMLEEVSSVLGISPQLRLDDSDVRLRGRRLEQVAIEVLASERGADAEVHYREWFELLRERGYLVAGKEPLNTFLTQINRSEAVERVGRRTGRYRLLAA